MAKKAGLGRGLDALFADAAPIFEEEPAEVIEAAAQEPDGEKGSTRKAAPKKAASGKTASAKAATSKAGAKTAGTKDDVPPEEDDRVLYIDINDIRPNSAQPRRNFDEEKLKELASSIRTNGVIQPLIVRESTGGYELVAGERRWRASRQAGLRTVPCIIRNFDDKQNAIVAIIENMQREDLDPIEEALGLKSMTETYGFTQEQVSASLGRSRTYITNTIRLLKLPEEIQHYVSTGQMSAAHGRTIINIPDKKRQMEVAEKIIKNDLSVRATEKLAEKVKDELRPERKKRKKKSDSAAVAASAEIQAVERELMSLTGTKVRIAGNEAMGKIELEYYSLEELNRLIEVFRDAFK